MNGPAESAVQLDQRSISILGRDWIGDSPERMKLKADSLAEGS
jgi:hypothetical protein